VRQGIIPFNHIRREARVDWLERLSAEGSGLEDESVFWMASNHSRAAYLHGNGADAVFRELLGPGVRDGVNRGLRRGVYPSARLPAEAGHRADVDERSGLAGTEVGQEGASGINQPEEIRVELVRNFFGRMLLDGAALGKARVVDEVVDLPAEFNRKLRLMFMRRNVLDGNSLGCELLQRLRSGGHVQRQDLSSLLLQTSERFDLPGRRNDPKSAC
jgi:hypothetical protein